MINYNDPTQRPDDVVDCYMERAIKHIDKEFGRGFAKANPALLAGFI